MIVVKLNSSGVAALLKSKAVQDELKRRADKIAKAVNVPEGGYATVEVNPKRARAAVIVAGMPQDEPEQALLEAVDAGRN